MDPSPSAEPFPAIGRGEKVTFHRAGDRVIAELDAAVKLEGAPLASVQLPNTAHGFVRIQPEGAKAGIEFALKGASAKSELQLTEGVGLYERAAEHGGDLAIVVGRDSVEDHVVLEAKPAEAAVEYTVKVEEVPGLRLYANVLEFLDASGVPQIRVRPPRITDSDGHTVEGVVSLPDCSADHASAAPWDRPITAPGAAQCTVRVSWDDKRLIYPAVVDPVWSLAKSLTFARDKSAAVKLFDGTVLVCGGIGDLGVALTSCEKFDITKGNPGEGAWATVASMNQPRDTFSILALQPAHGKDVLAVGGTGHPDSERYDPALDKWTYNVAATGDFSEGYFVPQMAAITSDGAYVVLIDANGVPYRYATASGLWSAGTKNPSPATPYRYDGMILTVPGQATIMRLGGYYGATYLTSAERYKPSTDSWSNPGNAGSMTVPRDNAAWAYLDSSRLLVYGGYTGSAYTSSGEVYNVTTNAWTLTTGAIPNGGSASNYYRGITSAQHSSGKFLLNSDQGLYLYDPAALSTPFARLETYQSNFSPKGSSANVIPVGTKVLMVPVTPSSGGSGAQTACRLFDLGGKGSICTANAECQAGLTCTPDLYSSPDGYSVCCDSACSDPCSSCRAVNKTSGVADGTCGPRRSDQYVGTTACPYTQSSTCGTTGYYCDGKGACAVYDASTVCVSGTCADGDTQNNTRSCDGKGACAAASTTDCATGYACVTYQGGACSTSCGSDSDCTSNYFCQYWTAPLNSCQPRKANGKTCSNFSNTECASGYCVDGVCCDKACNGACEGCSNALTGKTNGTCSFIPNGQASGSDCSTQNASTCGQTGVCDGKGACAKFASGTQCGDIGACASESSRYIPDLCDGLGSCVDKGTQNCNVGYSCQSGACNTSCTVDGNCAANYFCDTTTNACVADHTQGQTCKTDRQCAGNVNCVDGVCCDSACTGTCRSCLKNRTGLDTDGVCGNTLDDTNPEGECKPDVGYPASCNEPGLCDGNGSCRVYAKPGVVATADKCSITTLTVTKCDGAGNPKETLTSCYPYKCNSGGTGCRVACSPGTAKADCDDSSFCQDGKCVGQLPQGSACTESTQCKSGFCADKGVGRLEGEPEPEPGAGGDGPVDTADHPGVCCDAACGKGCEACKKSLKGQGADGTCDKVADHTDAKGDCKSSPDKACGHNNECDGNGNCRNVPKGASCGGSTCVGNSARGQICDGDGGCVNDSVIPCAPYVCRDVSGAPQCANPCATDDDCQDGYLCDNMACKKKLPAGQVCKSSAVCASNFCVDGVCCDVSCKGQCEACDVPGSEGVCSPVQGDPHGDRVSCDHAGEECGGQCDGVNSASCKYAAVGNTCGTTTCDNGLSKSSACNGQGECRPNKDAECAPYACGPDDSCLSRCEQDADCGDGYTCNETSGRCLPANATCSTDGLSSEGNGASTPCKPFLCVPSTGTCAVTCAFSTDCAPDFVCEPSSKTCLPAPTDTGGDDTGSCACRAAGATPSNHHSSYWALAALGVALTGLRRRRQSKPGRTTAKAHRFARDSHTFE